tara:strand:- start:907 stop:1650 length:744 start_codon:yes stop_codon:yes gene_type:complete
MAGHGSEVQGLGDEYAAILKMPKVDADQSKRIATKRAEAVEDKARADSLRNLQQLKKDCGQRLCPFKVATIENWQEYDDAMNATLPKLVDYIDDIGSQVAAGNSIFLIGPPGTGKDHLAIAVAREAVLRLGCSARWLDAAKFRSELRDAIKSTKDERTTFAPYLAAGVLIISDPVSIGSALTDYQADCLFRIIDGRYRDLRPTFITSNVKTQLEAESLLGSQIVDRLSHGGLRLRCSWESFRARGQR